ncbi:hypothetical protein Q1695_005715 [Nippostrongylus brasiliensis]|nr:hypothetical protein Q1695_005715 [Nippostrongylus brasiliensis]
MEPDSIDKLLNSLRRPTNGKPKSLWNKTLSFVDNLSKKPPPTQMAVGGVTGLFFSFLIPGPHHHPKLTFKDKTVLITGASSGLGRALAFELYKKGSKLILTARSIDKLKELCEELKQSFSGNPHEPVYSYLDVCEPMDVESLKDYAIDGKTIDVLINNAGLSSRGSVEDTPIKVYKQLMDVNFFGHIVVTQKLIDAIPDDGCIIATSSIQGKLSVPYRSAYSASKHAFKAFFDALRCESRPNLHILTVSPGYLNTGFGMRALDTKGQPVGKEDANQLKVSPLLC